MKEVPSEDCKRLQLNILLNVAKFCEKHNIKYSIAYGTLIGAIRHKGFIPWDDDIDIIMMRDEYERFVKTYHNEKYVLIHGENLSNHLHVVISDLSTTLYFPNSLSNQKFYRGGVWIDIFPIDYVPDKEKNYRRFFKSIWLLCRLQRIGEMVDPKSMLLSQLAHPLTKPFVKLFGRLAQNRMLTYNKKKTQTVANLSLWYLNYPSFKATFMNEFVEVPFEGYMFKAIKNYDSFLTGIYGDYMTPPPVCKRTPRHDYIAYWRE